MSEQFLYFLQQMFNGVTLGSTYALIAIGYTMVYGIIGMINFAHGEVYMISSYVSFMIIAALMMMGIDTGWLLVAAVIPSKKTTLALAAFSPSCTERASPSPYCCLS